MYLIKYLIAKLCKMSQYSPFALLYMIKAFILDFPVRLLTLKLLPEKASQIGLRYCESDYYNKPGVIKGRIENANIEINPDDGMYSSVIAAAAERGSNLLELSFHKPYKKPENDFTDFQTDNDWFNFLFRTKRCSVEIKNNIHELKEFYALIVSFVMKWIWNLDSFIIDSGKIRCTFKYGFYFFPYIPANKIERLVKELVIIASKYNDIAKKYQN